MWHILCHHPENIIWLCIPPPPLSTHVPWGLRSWCRTFCQSQRQWTVLHFRRKWKIILPPFYPRKPGCWEGISCPFLCIQIRVQGFPKKTNDLLHPSSWYCRQENWPRKPRGAWGNGISGRGSISCRYSGISCLQCNPGRSVRWLKCFLSNLFYVPPFPLEDLSLHI